jgi:hypothetical protein
LYLISPDPRILEVIILEKCGTGPELLKRSPTGMDEVVFSNVTKTENGRDGGLGRGEYRTGDMPASYRRNPENNSGKAGTFSKIQFKKDSKKSGKILKTKLLYIIPGPQIHAPAPDSVNAPENRSG